MAKDIDCSACEELRENAPNFVQNGITDTECNSLKNDTGFNPNLTTLHTDCEDLDTANDCLIGMMDGEIEKYEPCDWQEYMHKFIPNLYQLLKAFVCTICGIWTNIHNLWTNVNNLWQHMTQAEKDIDNLEDRMDNAEREIDRLWDETDRIDCIVDFMSEGASFTMGESTSGNAYAVAGRGVSFLLPHPGQFTSDLGFYYIAGGLMRGSGAFYFYNSDFTDDGQCGNFDYDTYRISQARRGNPWWGEDGRYAAGGELICEFRIKKSAYPQIKRFFNGFGQETGGGAYQVQTVAWSGGSGVYAYGQHGWCNNNGTPAESGYSSGHLVPEGWWYVQLRMTYCHSMTAHGTQYSPQYFMGVRMDTGKLDC